MKLFTVKDTLVRLAAEADHAAIVAFQMSMAMETEAVSLDAAKVSFGVRQVLLGCVPGHYLVAEVDGQLVGCVMVNPEWSDWAGKMQLWLNSIYVVPEHRRGGILRAMFNQVVANVDPDTTVRIKLYVDQDNDGAACAYEALGMEVQRYRLFKLDL